MVRSNENGKNREVSTTGEDRKVCKAMKSWVTSLNVYLLAMAEADIGNKKKFRDSLQLHGSRLFHQAKHSYVALIQKKTQR